MHGKNPMEGAAEVRQREVLGNVIRDMRLERLKLATC